MKSLNIKEEDVGRIYLDALEKVIEIRKERRAVWKDSFQKTSIDELLVMVKGKISRYEFMNVNEFPSEAEDCLVDGINYLFFALSNFINDNSNIVREVEE